MELSDKNEVKTGLVERYSEKFKNISKEQVGCFVEDGYLYAALMFFEEEWRLLELCKVDLDAETLEEVAKALDEVLAKNEFKEKRVSLIVPDKFLFEREFILEEKIPETDVRDVIYWDFQEKYFSSKKFGIVCYKLQDMVYKVFALEEKEQKRINEIFEQQNIRISDWMILPKELDFRLKGHFAEVAGTRLEVPINANIVEFEEDAAAIFAASVGVGLALNVENLQFPPLYKEEIYNWKRIAITVSIAAALLFGLTFAFDGVRLYCAEKEADAIEKEAQNFVADKTRMRLFNEIADDTNLRAKVIAEKTEKRLPLYGVLTHLGTLTEEGVIVKSVKMREKFLEIECEALSNRAMEAFLENLSERRDLYISSPTNLKTDENNRMRFSFSVDLRGK